jgi:hypothetical protein
MKQETIEEFINEELEDVFFTNISKRKEAERLIEAGAKWQQEQDKNKYSEEDMRKCWDACKRFDRPISEGDAPNFNEFIDTFKKK